MPPTRTLSLSNTHSTSTTLSTPFVVFGDACVSERAVVDVIDLVVEAEYARDRYEGNCPERSRSGQLTYLRALGGPWGPLGGTSGGPRGVYGGSMGVLGGPWGSRGPVGGSLGAPEGVLGVSGELPNMSIFIFLGGEFAYGLK